MHPQRSDRPCCDDDRSQSIHKTRGDHYTSSSHKAFEQPGDHVAGQGSVTCTVADTAYQLTPTPTPCTHVQLWNTNTAVAIWGDDTITTAGGYIPKSTEAVILIPIKDASLLHVACAAGGAVIKWAAIGREDQN